MSWIKTNFLWMMYRSGWGTKPGQEITLGVKLKRAFFESVLESVVPSAYESSRFDSIADWKSILAASNVRLQWDPDHGPSGEKRKRRAIQIGLRGTTLSQYGTQAILEVIDMSQFVSEQRKAATGGYENLIIPTERTFVPFSEDAAENIQLSIA